ncbi:CBS domain-containing protein [Mobilicoccus pelagius]|uniref:Inosine-5'-monophosphate dehydrogenase n=1 Tax=Mobilicoccus pelagius NBRC 104925 TaxID=1089455 RepID=H5UQ31_9MICO|nr:CBS domain-containing protein [Mobilicoccus pelagius]GAB47836.1 inosine-5'-monophosphate dehydrogenase [Mobilicoccus pelagius NBRC 104925]
MAPIVVTEDDPIATALSLLGKRTHRTALVVDADHRPVGLVTERDCHEVDRYATVADVLRRNLFTLLAGVDLDEAYGALESNHLGLAPVFEDDRLVDVLTRTGILRSAISPLPPPSTRGATRARGGRRHQR